jgi:hypothetical protein
MDSERPSRDDAEHAMRRLLRDHDLPEPDEILDHEDGIVCLWHGPKVAVIVEIEPRAGSGEARAVSGDAGAVSGEARAASGETRAASG